MTAARNRMRDKWADCDVMAQKINEVLGLTLTKSQVHDYLYVEITDGEQVKAGNREVITRLIGTPGWARMMDTPKPRIHQPKSEGEVKSPAEKVSLGMWFIKKIGDADEAVRVIKAAAAAVRSLEEK